MLNHPFESLPEVHLIVETLLFLRLTRLVEGADWAVVVPVGVLPHGPVHQVLVAGAHNYSQEGLELDQPEFGVEDPVACPHLGRGNQSEIGQAVMLAPDIALGVVVVAVDDEDRELHGHDRSQHLVFVAIGADH